MNAHLINHASKLPMFDYYTLADYGIHASLDGQKVGTRHKTIKARHSSKYFGLEKGVVSYSLIANHFPVNTEIIGPQEHESYYVLDMVYNNVTDVKIAAVSGDMHSINRVNFALLHLFGYRFMPRFTNLPQKAQNHLVSFKNPEELKHYLIKPKIK